MLQHHIKDIGDQFTDLREAAATDRNNTCERTGKVYDLNYKRKLCRQTTMTTAGVWKKRPLKLNT